MGSILTGLRRLLAGVAAVPEPGVPLAGRARLVEVGVARGWLGVLGTLTAPPLSWAAKASTGSSPLATAALRVLAPLLILRNWNPMPSGVLAPKYF